MNNNQEAAAKIISDFTGIDIAKITYFLNNFGIDQILQNPSIIGVDSETEKKLSELKELLDLGSKEP